MHLICLSSFHIGCDNVFLNLLKKNGYPTYKMTLYVALFEHVFNNLAPSEYLLDDSCMVYTCICGCNVNVIERIGNTSVSK